MIIKVYLMIVKNDILSNREPVNLFVSLLYRSVPLYIEHYDAALGNDIAI